MAQDYNATINLPKTDFPMRAGLPNREPGMLERWEKSDIYNELLKKNADLLKMGTIEVARESERGIVDMETVRYTNEQLIGTLDEVLRIQAEGRQKRAAAEQELAQIEARLRRKLLGQPETN